MKRIFTVTPNPVLDLTGTVQAIVANEKTYVQSPSWSPGGNALNVARVLDRLGDEVVAGGFLGGGTGEEIRRLLRLEKVANEFVKIKGSTRVNVTVSEESSHRQTRLSFPGPKISGAEKKRLLRQIRNRKDLALLVIGGSLPPGFYSADVRALIRAARLNGVETIVDCPGEILANAVAAKPLLIKPNLREFAELTGENAKTIKKVREIVARKLSHLPLVCVSSIEGGTLLIAGRRALFGRIPPVKIRSTVGAGDSLVAGMASLIARGETDLSKILRQGIAASAATLSHTGVDLGSGTEIRQLYKQAKVRELASLN